MNLPEEDEERWFDWIERMFSNALLDKDDQREAVRDVEAYIDALIAERKAGAARRLHRDAPRGRGRRPPPDRPRGAPVRRADAARGVRDDLRRDGDEPSLPRRAPRAAPAALRRRRRARAQRGQRAPALPLSRPGLLPKRDTRPGDARRDDPRRRRRPARLRRREPRSRGSSTTPTAACSTAARTPTSPSVTGVISAWARTSPGSS